jgi:translation initiation factor 2B subunit (eIF-2B alpha/beta/delta family)
MAQHIPEAMTMQGYRGGGLVEDTALIQAGHTLRRDRVHGAMELAVRAVESAVALVNDEPARDIAAVARALATARPSMAAIANAVALTLAPVATGAVERSSLGEHGARLKKQWQEDAPRLIENAELHIPKAILTYSNSSTTQSALIALKDRVQAVIIPEGRPIEDGKRLARALAAVGIPITVITEAQMGWWVREVGAVVVGADTVAPDGSVYNHMGTATLALLAKEHGVPVYALTHTLKVAPYDRPEDMREENDPAEIWADPPPGITIRNPAFDRTPADRIQVITERGILTDALRAAIVAEHRAAWEAVGLERVASSEMGGDGAKRMPLSTDDLLLATERRTDETASDHDSGGEQPVALR